MTFAPVFLLLCMTTSHFPCISHLMAAVESPACWEDGDTRGWVIGYQGGQNPDRGLGGRVRCRVCAWPHLLIKDPVTLYHRVTTMGSKPTRGQGQGGDVG